jgi:anti-sigma B factor antagonist
MSRSAHEGTIGGSLRPRGPTQLTLSIRQSAREIIVSVTGELDVLTVPRLATALDDIVRRGEGDVVMDLTRAGFIDSLGLHALLTVQRRLAERSRRFTVICDAGPVRHSIELARLTEPLGVVPSFAEYELHRCPRDTTPHPT